MKMTNGRIVAMAVVFLTCAMCGRGGGFPVGEPDQTSRDGLTVDESRLRATVLEGEIDLEMVLSRLESDRDLDGTITVELLNISGDELGHRTASLSMDEGESESIVRIEGLEGIPEGTSAGDLAQYMVRYRVEADDAYLSGRRSLYMMAQRIASVVMGNDELYEGQPAYMRVAANDPSTMQPMAGADVEVLIETAGEGDEIVRTALWQGSTDEFGTADVELTPQGVVGGASLIVRLSHGEQASESRHPVTVQRSHRVLLTTDKPLYQPGQDIHIRALSFRLPDNAASAGAEVTLEVLDAKGNMVFRQQEEANDFGIASATFRLARMVNMGRYTIRATVDDAIQERTVTVDRYALPRFSIGFEADRPFYLPGEQLQGHVDVNYTFGQPVTGGSVLVRASQFDVDWVQFAELHGTTSEDGSYDFEIEMPSYFVGLPLEQGGSFVKLAIEVTDTAGQVFEIERAITVAQGAATAYLIPERPVLAPGVDNEIFLLTADPTGAPLSTDCQVTVNNGESFPVETDERGFASFHVNPEENVGLSINVHVNDGRGGSTNIVSNFTAGEQALDTVLLRTDRSLYSVGDTAELSIYSPRVRDRVYLDAVRGGQTALTDIVSVEEGWNTVELDLTEQLTGAINLSVYYIADSGDIIRDQRLVFVEGANDLSLEMELDRSEYRPAETARLSVQIADAAGEGVQAAIGLQVVDEAVFALSEQNPGLERIFFQLEEEIAQPAYEVHGFETSSVFAEGDPDVKDARSQQAAKVLFAAGSGVPRYGIDYSSEGQLLELVRGHGISAISSDVSTIVEHMGALLEGMSENDFNDLENWAQSWIESASSSWYDPWGQRYQATYSGSSLVLDSAGCDETWDTDDDISASGHVDLWVGMDEREMMWDFANEAPNAADGADAGVWADPGDDDTGGSGGSGGGDGPRIRTWFPETLFVDPSIITDANGRASVEIPLADSITTWRASAIASSRGGALGSNTTGITVFQDFFVDLALPATLTLGDEITVPVVVYNYLDSPQTVEVEVTEDEWFTLMTPAIQMVTLAPREVSSVPLRIRAEQVGWRDLQAVGRAGDVADGLRRRIEVMPSGRQTDRSQSDVLEGSPEGTRVAFDFEIPAGSVPGANELLVKLYPGVFAQAIEGLDSILRMPSGCFEQTSSSTYPNVMVLAYMQLTDTVTPEIELQAREYISQGYQRLLTFEVDGGGFEWFGSPPAHSILTAYGLMEFSDMAEVHPVDQAVIDRTATWLAGRQNSDGSFTPDEGGIAEGAINNYENDTYRTTAYILWALAQSGYTGPAISSAVSYLRSHRSEAANSYSRAIAAQALITVDPNDSTGAELLDELAEEAVVENQAASWGGEEGAEGLTYSMGNAHVLETTALVVDAFLLGARHQDLANQGLTFLVRNKDSLGNWQTTQATVYVLRAMIRSISSSASEANGTVDVYHNGDLIQSVAVTPADYDVFRQIDLKEHIVEDGANTVELIMTGEGSLMYQTVGTYWTPWDDVTEEPVGALSIDVSYDRTSLAVDDTATAQVTVTNNTSGSLMMVMVDLGVPPGFDVQTGDLDELIASGGLFQRYETTGRQILLYFDEIQAGPPVTFNYRLVARNPMRGEAPSSSAYLYYDPEVRTSAPPVSMSVE